MGPGRCPCDGPTLAASRGERSFGFAVCYLRSVQGLLSSDARSPLVALLLVGRSCPRGLSDQRLVDLMDQPLEPLRQKRRLTIVGRRTERANRVDGEVRVDHGPS